MQLEPPKRTILTQKRNPRKRKIELEEEGEDLLVNVGESESPRVIYEEDVGVLGHGIRGENEAPHAAILAGLDMEVFAAVEGLGGELLEEAAV